MCKVCTRLGRSIHRPYEPPKRAYRSRHLTEDQVQQIRCLWDEGVLHSEILSRIYGMHRNQIRWIGRRVSLASVPEARDDLPPRPAGVKARRLRRWVGYNDRLSQRRRYEVVCHR